LVVIIKGIDANKNEDVMCDDYPPSPKHPNEEEKAAADDKTAED